MISTNKRTLKASPLLLISTVSILTLSLAYLIYSMVFSERFGLLTPDAIISYLPLANKLIEAPLTLWSEPIAITVAPGGYIYMALAGAQPDRIFILNIILAALSVLLIFDLCRRLGGLSAGLAGALLYCFSPLLIEVLIPTLNEPPYLFFTALWLWGSVLIRDKPEKKWPIIISGLALLFSILTRAIYFYWLFPAVFTCFLIFLFSKKSDLKKLCLRIMAAHLIAAAGAGAYTLHNWKTHETPMIATGSGTALYFGSHLVTYGYEPPYLDMTHDAWMVTDEVNSHLTPKNDRRLSFAAKQMLLNMPAKDLISLYVNKLGAILFFSQANLEQGVFNERAFRIVLLTLALVGFFYNIRNILILMLFFVLLYVTAVHVPAMYNQRYSIGALDLPLTLLAALGVAHLIHNRSNKKLFAAVLFASIGGIAIGSLHLRYSPPLMPRIDKGISYLALKAPLENLEYQGFSGNPFIEPAIVLEKHTSIIWKDISNHKRGGTPIISIDIEKMDQRCKRLDFTYTDKEHNTWQSSMPLKKPKAPLTLNVGSLSLDNIDKYNSQLEIQFRCPVDSKLKINKIALYVVQTGLHYRKQLPIELK